MYNQLFNDFPFVQHSFETSSSDEEQDNKMNKTIECVPTTTATPKRNVDIFKEIDFKDYHLVKQSIYRQMITALEAIHNLHIVHCVIKLQNFVVGRNNRLLLINFGDAKIGKRVEEKYVWENNGQVGTFEFMAPEIYHQFDPPTVYTPAVDIWASGIVLYILTYAQVPFNEGNNRLKTFEKLSEGRLPLPDMLPQNLPDEPFYDNIVNVIRCACCPLPEYRLSANDLLKSNYLVNAPVFCPLQF
ncbi:hypothetical protein SNEBB_007126 [Seison nebaliae]|nr:hypothetical protein SNEBB_007126 [Seison nebaliae]